MKISRPARAKNYYRRENRTFSELTRRGKNETIAYYLISLLLFLITSFLFFDVLYVVCNIVGSIVSGTPKAALAEFLRMFPQILACATFIFLSVIMHKISAPLSNEYMRKHYFRGGIATIALGGVLVVYVVVGLIVGIYHTAIDGNPTPIYPLDHILLGLILIGVGIVFLCYERRLRVHHSSIAIRPSKKSKAMRVIDTIFYTIAYMITAYACAALFYSPFVADWTHGHVFYLIMLDLSFVASLVMAATWKYLFTPLKEEEKIDAQFWLSICALLTNGIIFWFYYMAIVQDPMAPNDAAFGLMPVEYTASVNLVTYLFRILNSIGPLVALIKSLIAKAKRASLNKIPSEEIQTQE